MILSLQKQLEKPLQSIEGMAKTQKNVFFENQTIDYRKTAHQKWPKIIYSLIYSTDQVYILKLQLKLNCFIGLAVIVVFAHVATENRKLWRIQRKSCFKLVISSHNIHKNNVSERNVCYLLICKEGSLLQILP